MHQRNDAALSSIQPRSILSTIEGGAAAAIDLAVTPVRLVSTLGDALKRPGNSTEGQLEQAFAKRSRGLRIIARRAGAHDEEDVLQDAFLRIVERSRREEIPKLDNLLARVVRCLAIDRLRRRATRSAYAASEAGESAVDAVADPERSLMGAQRLKRVLAAIEAMPPRRREVFLLHRVEELTYAQIARQLGVSLKAVEKHLHLAMRQLSDTDD